MNYYELLEIAPSASVEVIKNAYKTLAKKYHPDTYKGDRNFAEEKMKLLNEAVSILGDAEKREEYDKINGIYHGSYLYDMSDDYYKDIESKLNINVDENGEPVFFSSGLNDDSYMDTIDDFISNKKPGKKSKKKSKNYKNPVNTKGSNRNVDDADDAYDISDISDINIEDIEDISELNKTDNINFNYNSYDGASNETDAADFKTFKMSGKKRSKKSDTTTPKWYYIALIIVIAANIAVLILILNMIKFSNIRDIMSGLSGKSQEIEENNSDSEDNTDIDITSADEYETRDFNSKNEGALPGISEISEIAAVTSTTNENENENPTYAPADSNNSAQTIKKPTVPPVTLKPKPPVTTANIAPTETMAQSAINLSDEITTEPAINETISGEEPTSDELETTIADNDYETVETAAILETMETMEINEMTEEKTDEFHEIPETSEQPSDIPNITDITDIIDIIKETMADPTTASTIAPELPEITTGEVTVELTIGEDG